MRILIFTFYYTPELGAAPSRITNMARGLKAQGNDVDVLTCLPNYPKGRIMEGYRRCFSRKEEMEGVRLFRYWTYATVSKNPLRRILSMLSFSILLWSFSWRVRRIRSYDRVIIQSPPIMVACSAMVLFRKIFRRKVVLNVSDLWPMSAVELGAVREGSLYHRALLWMERFVYRNSSAVQGQSETIVEHIKAFEPDKPAFVYRNLQHSVAAHFEERFKGQPLRIVYAGLLGVAQDLLSIIEHINFKQIGAELHLFGGGNQTEQIEQFISNHDTGVSYHGYLPKERMVDELQRYDASIVPLAVQIKGAVPSKIFDLLPVGVPILLCGSGESSDIVRNNGFGLVSSPADYDALAENIRKMVRMSAEEYGRIRQNCWSASLEMFNFNCQMDTYNAFLNQL